MGHARHKRADGPKLVGLQQHLVFMVQLLDHVVESLGQLGKLILVFAGRQNGRKVALPDPPGILHETVQGQHQLPGQENRHKHHQHKHNGHEIKGHALGQQEHAADRFLLFFHEIFGKGHHLAPELAQVRNDPLLHGLIPGLAQQHQLLVICRHQGGHGAIMLPAQNLFNGRCVVCQDGVRHLQVFMGLRQTGAVEQVILFKPPGLLNLHQIAVRHFQKVYLVLKPCKNPVGPAGHGQGENKKEKKRNRHLHPNADRRPLVQEYVFRRAAVVV